MDGIYTDFYYKVHKMILEFEPGDKVINAENIELEKYTKNV